MQTSKLASLDYMLIYRCASAPVHVPSEAVGVFSCSIPPAGSFPRAVGAAVSARVPPSQKVIPPWSKV